MFECRLPSLFYYYALLYITFNHSTITHAFNCKADILFLSYSFDANNEITVTVFFYLLCCSFSGNSRAGPAAVSGAT